MLRQRSPQQQQPRQQPRRFAVTQKGEPCKLCIRKGAFCHLHQSHQSGKTEHPLTEVIDEQPSSTIGVTQKGAPCKLCFRMGVFCHLHQGQRNGSDTGFGTAGNEGRSPPSIGITRKGVPCKLCLRKGVFCHLHNPTGTTEHAVSDERSPPSPLFGMTQKGDPCKLCVRKGTFCHLHHLQSRWGETNEFEAATVHTKQHQPSKSLGVLPMEDMRGVGFDKQALQPSSVFSTTRKELPPRIVTGTDDFCLPVAAHKDRNVPFRKEDWRAPEPYSQPSMVFGTTQAGAPCKLCLQKGDFCHLHEKQKVFGMTQKGEPCKLCIRKGDFCHHHETQKVFGMTLKGEPCKLCIRKGDYCHHHEKQRGFGVTRRGEPCKICIRKGDFCGFHKMQKPISREESMAQGQPSELSRVFGISKNGEPCRTCVRKGDFCHYHEKQREGNEWEDGTICPGDLPANPVRPIRRSCSLLALAVLLQYLFFNALHEWAGETTHWDRSSCHPTMANNKTLGVVGNESAPNCHQPPFSFPLASTMLHAFGRETPPPVRRINGFDSVKPLQNPEPCGDLHCQYSEWAEWASFS